MKGGRSGRSADYRGHVNTVSFGIWLPFRLRREALLVRVEVEDLRLRPVAAGRCMWSARVRSAESGGLWGDGWDTGSPAERGDRDAFPFQAGPDSPGQAGRTWGVPMEADRLRLNGDDCAV